MLGSMVFAGLKTEIDNDLFDRLSSEMSDTQQEAIDGTKRGESDKLHQTYGCHCKRSISKSNLSRHKETTMPAIEECLIGTCF